MGKRIKISILVIFTLGLYSFYQNPYKVVRLYKNEISFNVPQKWKLKENAMRFAVYEIEYDVEVKDAKGHSGIALYVYGSKYGPRMGITDSIVAVRKLGMLSDPKREIMIEESGIKIISGINVGYIKYTFRVNSKLGRSYGIDLFFCNKEYIYHKVEIIGLNRPINEFKNVAEKVFDSFKME